MAEKRLEDLDLDRVFSARHLHLCSYFLQRALRPKFAELFCLAKQAGLATSLDTNDDPEDRWELDLVSVLKSVHVLLSNEGEACRLAQCDDAETALRVLAEYVPLVVMKRGEKGAVARCGREEVNAVPVLVDLVYTIGAGDSFDAGFLNNFIRGASLEACLRLGNLAGALSTTRQGGTEAFREAAHRSAFLKQ